MGKKTIGTVIIPKGTSWTKLCEDAHFIQNVDNRVVYFYFSDTQPDDSIGTRDCHILRQEQDDNYVNSDGDTIWVKQQPHFTQSLVITQV